MSQITIEAIEKILEAVPNASYKQAKEALIEHDGNVVEAIIDLKDKLGKPKKEILGKDAGEIKDQVIDLIKKSTVVKLIIEKDGKDIVNVPIAVGIVGAIIGPMAMLVGLSAAVLSKSRIKIESDDAVIDLGEFTEEKFTIVKDIISSKSKDVKSTKVKKEDTKIEKEEVQEIVINLNKNKQ